MRERIKSAKKRQINNVKILFSDTQDGRKAKVICKIEGDKLIGEQRDRKTSELQVIATKYVNENDELVEVIYFLAYIHSLFDNTLINRFFYF